MLTSQAAGAWLEYVPRKGWPLLTPTELTETTAVETIPKVA